MIVFVCAVVVDQDRTLSSDDLSNQDCRCWSKDCSVASEGKVVKGVKPSMSSFNAVFRVLVDEGKLDKGVLLLKQMP